MKKEQIDSAMPLAVCVRSGCIFARTEAGDQGESQISCAVKPLPEALSEVTSDDGCHDAAISTMNGRRVIPGLMHADGFKPRNDGALSAKIYKLLFQSGRQPNPEVF